MCSLNTECVLCVYKAFDNVIAETHNALVQSLLAKLEGALGSMSRIKWADMEMVRTHSVFREHILY